MGPTSTVALQLLVRRQYTLRELSQDLRTSYSRAAGIARQLIQEGYAERFGGTLLLARNAKAELVKSLSSRFKLEPLLSDAQSQVLLTLLEPKPVDAIQLETGLSQSAVYGALRKLGQVGAVEKLGSSYRLREDEDLKGLVAILRREEAAKGAEPFATSLKTSRNGLLLKRVSAGTQAQGRLTGFSLFPKFGVEYFSPYDYYLDPPEDLGPEAVVVHALASSQSRTDRTMCALFILKNRTRLNLELCRKLAGEWGVLQLWLDVQRMAEGILPEKTEMFLPWTEYAEKAKVYGLTMINTPSSEAGLKLLRELGARLHVTTQAYLFGGGNMLLRGLKAATKDVDVILNDKDTFHRITRALNGMGFKRLAEERMESEDRRLQPSGIYTADESPRVDLFTGKVCGALQLVGEMKARAEERRFHNLHLKLLSLEDVFLFKSITDRAGDLDDMSTILRMAPGFDWASVLNTYWREEKITGRHFCFTILDNLEILQQKEGITIPIHRRLLQHCVDTSIIEAVKGGASTVREIKSLVDFPEHRLRNRIRVLISDRKLSKRPGTRRLKLARRQ